MKLNRPLSYFALVLLSACTCHAEWTVKVYQQSKLDSLSISEVRSIQEGYITGILEGIGWANSAAFQRNGKYLYCAPEKLALTYDNAINIIDKEIRKVSLIAPEKLQDYFVGLLLEHGLEETFPCSTK